MTQDMETISRAMVMRKIAHNRGHMPTHAQTGVMLAVSHHGPQSVKELATMFRMTSSAVTQLVNGLVADGLLKRIGDETDRRKTSVHITAKGKRQLSMARKHRLQAMRELFTPLTDKELEHMRRLHLKITERLQAVWMHKK